MAKKASTKVDAVAAPIQQLKIDEMSLLRLNRLSDKERAARMELMVASGALNTLVQELVQKDEKAKKIADRVQALQAEQKKAGDDYVALVTRIGSELNINMSEYAYDDETGVLSPLPKQT